MTDNPSLQQVHFTHQPVAAAAVENHLAITLHGTQTAPQRFQRLIIMQIQRLCYLLTLEGLGRLFQQLHDEFTTGDGIVIFTRFALGKGIGWGRFF